MNSCRKDFLRFLSKQLAVAQHFKKLLGFSRNFLFEITTSSCLRDLSFLAAKLICASKDYLAFLNIFRQNFPFLIRWQFEKKKSIFFLLFHVWTIWMDIIADGGRTGTQWKWLIVFGSRLSDVIKCLLVIWSWRIHEDLI